MLRIQQNRVSGLGPTSSLISRQMTLKRYYGAMCIVSTGPETVYGEGCWYDVRGQGTVHSGLLRKVMEDDTTL